MSGRITSSYLEVPDLEAAYELTLERGWGDGLPVIPPTEERIAQMLDYVGLDPGLVVGEIPPLNGKATVEKIAINAIMAGCRPEYLPVVIATVEAVLEPPFNLSGVQTTTNPAAPMIVVNGPIRKEINLNCGTGCFGPGWRANATIGRALRLIMLSLGGATPGPVAKSMFSLPERYTFCFGEDEEHSPWTPLHVERGFPGDTSTVTVLAVDILFQLTYGASMEDQGQRLAEVAGQVLTRTGHPATLFHSGQPCVVLPAVTASRLARFGVSKEDLKAKVFEQSRVPAEDLPEYQLYRKGGAPVHHTIDGNVQPCEKAEDVLVLVAGGDMPAYIAILPSFYECKAVTKAVRVPRR